MGEPGLETTCISSLLMAERPGWPSGSNPALETRFGTDIEFELQSVSKEEAESQSLDSRTKEGEGGGG